MAPQQAFQALVTTTQRNGSFHVKNVDTFSLVVEFSSAASMFTWGENFWAQVVPAEGGSVVRVPGVGKVGGQIQQNARLAKLINELFQGVVYELQQAQP